MVRECAISTIMSKQPDDTTKEAGSNVFSIAAVAKPKKRKDKWPDAVLSRGYSMIPSILLWGQAKMGLKPDELNVLLQLIDRKSTRLNSSHVKSSYAVFCLKKK